MFIVAVLGLCMPEPVSRVIWLLRACLRPNVAGSFPGRQRQGTGHRAAVAASMSADAGRAHALMLNLTLQSVKLIIASFRSVDGVLRACCTCQLFSAAPEILAMQLAYHELRSLFDEALAPEFKNVRRVGYLRHSRRAPKRCRFGAFRTRQKGGVRQYPKSALAPPHSSQLGGNSKLKGFGSQQTPAQSLVQCWLRRTAKMGGAGDIGPS